MNNIKKAYQDLIEIWNKNKIQMDPKIIICQGKGPMVRTVLKEG